MINTIDGALFRQMLSNASAEIVANTKKLNELNVFPVPDGDTGTNMSMTISAAAKDVCAMTDHRIGKSAERCASMLLRSARGNSGVILSLLFRGLSKGLKECDRADTKQFALAMKEGVAAAYGAVMRPAEGTILTVSRLAADEAVKISAVTDDFEEFFKYVSDAAQTALAETMHQNPVLEKAQVVDAGGQGWVYVLEGFSAAIRGELVEAEGVETKTAGSVFEQFDTEDIRFSYCTEFIVQRDDVSKDPLRLRAYLESIGDCVVVVDDDEIIKVHVHTNHPGNAMEEGLKFGSLTSMKVENMKQQHTQKLSMSEAVPVEDKEENDVATPEKKYGFVAVAAGEGIREMFTDLGADKLVEGGQTMNPSTEDILKAVNFTPSEVVFVLPNNKNIIMAAQQVQALTDKQVVVLQTKTIPQGISAMLAFDMGLDTEENTAAMTEAFAKVRSASITYAARNSEFDGHNIKQGDYLALAEGKMCYTGSDLSEAVMDVMKAIDGENAEIVTVFRGCDASEQQNQIVEEVLPSCVPNAELNVLDGGQPVYYYLISAE